MAQSLGPGGDRAADGRRRCRGVGRVRARRRPSARCWSSRQAAPWWSCSPTGWWRARRCRTRARWLCSTACAFAPLLAGWRGAPAVDIDALADVIVAFSRDGDRTRRRAWTPSRPIPSSPRRAASSRSTRWFRRVGQNPRDGVGLLDRTGVPEEARLGRGVLPGGGRAARLRVPVRGPLAGSRRSRRYVRGLQQQVKDQGLWAIFLDEELGGPGFGQLKLGAAERDHRPLPGRRRRCSAPPRPTPGTWRCSPPTAPRSRRSGGSSRCSTRSMFSAYSMTEPQGGSDPNLFKTHAVRDGDEWVINGEKWFTSAGPRRRHPLRDVHERHVRRAAQDARASRSSPSRATTTTSSTTTCACRSTTCSAPRTAPRCSRSGASAAAASTTRCAPSPSASSPST